LVSLKPVNRQIALNACVVATFDVQTSNASPSTSLFTARPCLTLGRVGM
jgi:hypothetical protein